MYHNNKLVSQHDWETYIFGGFDEDLPLDNDKNADSWSESDSEFENDPNYEETDY
jgi:hypothetical protein